MKSSKTFSILFWINTSRAKNNQAEIYARITVDGKRVNISLKRKVNVDKWNISKKRVNGTSAIAKQTNRYLDEAYAQLFQIYQDLKFKGELITAQIIKSYYNGEHSDQGKTLKDIMRYHSSKIKNTLAPGTIRNFGITENYIFKFLNTKKKTSNIYLKQLNYEFLTDFEIYLTNLLPAGHPKALSHNTVMKHIQRFRKIITLAYHMEWIEKEPFVRWKMTFEKTEVSGKIAMSDMSFGVRGNCGMCKNTIETAANAVDGVTNASWDVNKKKIDVSFDDTKTDLMAIHKAIAASGYDTEKVMGNEDAYKNLPGCCQYDHQMKMNQSGEEKADDHSKHMH